MSLLHIFIFAMMVILPVAFLFFFYTGFRGDRSKGRKRCRKCWHSMEGLPKGEKGWICPECGTLARTEKHLHKSKRYWWRIWICTAVLLLGALTPYGFVVADRWEDEEYKALIPTMALVAVYPRQFDTLLDEDSLGTKIDNLLDERYLSMWDWQHELIPEPAFPHDIPDPASLIEVPEVWVAGEPLAVKLTVRNWARGRAMVWTSVIGAGFEEDDRDNDVRGAEDLDRVDDPAAWTEHTGWVYLEPVTEQQPSHDIQMQCLIIAGWDFACHVRKDYRTPVTTPAPRFVSMEEAVNGAVTEPVTDPAFDAWLLEQDWFGLEFSFGNGRAHSAYVWGPDNYADYDNYMNDAPMDVNVRAEIWDGDERLVASTLRQDLMLNWYGPIDELYDGHDPLHDDPYTSNDELFRRLLGASDEEAATLLDRMTVRLVPVPELALQPPEHGRYWVPGGGAPYLEMPLREALAGGSDGIDPESAFASQVRAALATSP